MTLAVAHILGLPRADMRQAEILADLEGRSRGSAYDQLARELGWMRARIPTENGGWVRRWVREEWCLAFAEFGYRHTGGSRKRDARLRVSPERRREIARLGAQARWRK